MAQKPEHDALRKKYHLTPKQAVLVRARTADPTASDSSCARAANYSDPSGNAHKHLNKPRVRSALNDLLAQRGIDDEKLCAKALELLDAQTVDRNGKPTPEYGAQVRVLELLMKVKSWLTDQHINIANIVGSDAQDVMKEASQLFARYQRAGGIVGATIPKSQSLGAQKIVDESSNPEAGAGGRAGEW